MLLTRLALALLASPASRQPAAARRRLCDSELSDETAYDEIPVHTQLIKRITSVIDGFRGWTITLRNALKSVLGGREKGVSEKVPIFGKLYAPVRL